MQENISLETILSIITGISCTDDFDKVFELAWFVYDDKLINSAGLGIIKDELKEHLLNIHPELKDINYSKCALKNKIYLESWLKQQKEKFGETLPVSRLGEPLDESCLVVHCPVSFVVSKDKKEEFLNVKSRQRKENQVVIEKIKEKVKCETELSKVKSLSKK